MSARHLAKHSAFGLMFLAWSAILATVAAAAGQPYCGPWCVEYVLKYYGHDADLIALIREIQWPDLESGASLDAMDRALRTRGLHTFAMTISPEARLNWPFPVILHLRGEGGSQGHFVVWLPPSRTDEAQVWWGLDGIHRVSESQLAAQRSGAVLLTSPQPIEDPPCAIQFKPSAASMVLRAVGLSGCIILALVYFVHFRTSAITCVRRSASH